MNAYLEIAEKVLRSAKIPMSAREILKRAYLSDIAPTHIYGQTQHKTLQARLSEDILKNRKTLFCRTEPGCFCLKEFLGSSSVFQARRRTRDLLRGNILTINTDTIKCCEKETEFIDSIFLKAIIANNKFSYREKRKISSAEVMVLAGISLIRGRELLSYRLGRYRDDRDAFANKKSLLFLSVLTDKDNSFFSDNDLGLRDKAISVIAADLDVAVSELYSTNWKTKNCFKFFIRTSERYNNTNVIVAFLEFETPESFEPLGRKLSLNNLGWLDLDKMPNNLEDFDPYSQAVLSYYIQGVGA